MRAWLVRHAVALVVVVVSLPLLVGLLWGIPSSQRSEPKPVVIVPAGEEIVVDGFSWRLSASKEFSQPDVSTPRGLSLVAAILRAEPAGASGTLSCDVALVAGERRWPEVSNPAQFGFGVAATSTSLCASDNAAIDLEVVFVTPTGVANGAAVEVSLREPARVLRFLLE